MYYFKYVLQDFIFNCLIFVQFQQKLSKIRLLRFRYQRAC